MQRAIGIGIGTVMALSRLAHADMAPVPEPSPAEPIAPPAAMAPIPAPPPAPLAIHRAAVTFGPILLILPVLEVNAEVALGPKLGLEAIVGGGKVTPKNANGTSSGVSVSVYEVGVSGRYYALGNFDTGLQLGAQALFLKASGASGNVSAVANGLGVSPFIGYKHTFDPGFVLELEGGATFVAYDASASNGSTASQKKVIGMLRINLGWAF